MIPYGRQDITVEDIRTVEEVLRSDFITQGPKVEEFEAAFAKYIGSKYAVAVSSGTAALHVAALALGVKNGTSVISSPLTFVASTNCVLYAGGKVVFIDIDEKSQVIDADKLTRFLERKRSRIKGIVAVDYAGYPIDTEKLYKLAKKHGLFIIEDACHALGGYFTDSHGRKNYCGNARYADVGIFSFHPVKHITTGEGGMITTNDKKIHEKLLLLRNHGITKDPAKMGKNDGGWFYEMQTLGFNYRITDLQCALGISQLKRIDSNLRKRRKIAQVYNQRLRDLSIELPQGVKGHAYHLYVIKTDKRKELYDFLRRKGIYAQVHYIPVHLQPYYKKFGWKKGDFKVAEEFYDQCLSLPMYPSLTSKEQEYVIDCLKSFYEEEN